jgi:hypothetical protein
MQEARGGLTIPILHDTFRAVTPRITYCENGAVSQRKSKKDITGSEMRRG